MSFPPLLVFVFSFLPILSYTYFLFSPILYCFSCTFPKYSHSFSFVRVSIAPLYFRLSSSRLCFLLPKNTSSLFYFGFPHSKTVSHTSFSIVCPFFFIVLVCWLTKVNNWILSLPLLQTFLFLPIISHLQFHDQSLLLHLVPRMSVLLFHHLFVSIQKIPFFFFYKLS